MNLKNLSLMESERIKTGNFDISYYQTNTLVIGSGVASLNAAINLHSMGQKDILIATSEWGGGTSNNAGSDKQTYYKLSIAGNKPDSVPEMTKDLCDGKCMHGDIALCEAQGSVRAFMNLVNLGVPFPHDKFGAYAGYKTDNDPHARATSAGPYTSKMMFGKLAAETKRRKIKILDRHHVVALLTDAAGLKVIGALAINTREKDPFRAFALVNAVNIILGTGGPGGIYETSVYPVSQSGSTGIAFKAGATGQNLTESQFGIASLKFKWNLSGSYQQVIPRYYSSDKKGKNEIEFLNDSFPDYSALTKAIFLKGYQWPFDPRKISGNGSSLIDLLVYKEIEEKGRRVFIDFRRNPSWGTEDRFLPDMLDPEIRHYLGNSDALKSIPVERLMAMNTPAYLLYKEHGIDLGSEPLQAAVCAQHNNGGLKGNIWWESDLKHLFPVGEVNGSHGVYRPGGSALNSGQVGSFRAARFIARKYNAPNSGKNEFLSEAGKALNEELLLAGQWLSSGRSGKNSGYLSVIRKRMSGAGNIVRSINEVEKAKDEAYSLLSRIKKQIGAASVKELADCYQLVGHCLTHYMYLTAIDTYIRKGGRSRGSYIVTRKKRSALPPIPSPDLNIELCNYDKEIEKNILEVKFKNGDAVTNLVKVREIPLQNLWFEKVWKEYLEDNFADS
jgi:succinate dehydrogenase/fumarate reductase flavoprotein subunit